jgi:hypothetical protein
MTDCLDHMTAADRIGTSLGAKRARAWAYLNENQLSVLKHGFCPTRACDTDVTATWARRSRRAYNQPPIGLWNWWPTTKTGG